MRVQLLTVSGAKFDDEALEVRLKTAMGAMVILPHHEALTAITETGPVTIVDGKNNEEVFVSYGGLVDVRDNTVHMLVDEAEYADDLIEEEIHEALLAARALKDAATEQHELDEAQRMIDRHTVRLEVARIRRKPRP